MVLVTTLPVRCTSRLITVTLAVALLPGCAAVGSMMSPYPEKFSCKNDDHGQCIHPERAYEDAVAGTASKSDPAVSTRPAAKAAFQMPSLTATRSRGNQPAAYEGYRDSVYRELKGLIDEPVTPMLKPARTVRTLILPYADQTRPDRLYMPRYVYSILDRPSWVVGGTLVRSPGNAERAPVLEQVKDLPDGLEPANDHAPNTAGETHP
ncbi:TraV family lipoprotein [Novosphingobium sp. KA1]|uniref:TraV family lipoprotein n=1 Tax=Novosphingobium sp. (strain KA1) TaxID=164608 RepID=UPI001F5DC681|nr:TraV family lipoprotein [Novosphingobium sp. KA1]